MSGGNRKDAAQKQSALRYLFEDAQWHTVSAKFERSDQLPPDALISNINIVPYVAADQWVVIRLTDGMVEVPGGTREPDEAWQDTIRRELAEEAGARLLSFRPFGAWWCRSAAEQPYRPHLPHPEFYRLVGVGQVEIVGQPTNPDDGEQVAAVEILTLEEARAAFVGSGRPDLADLYTLAADVLANMAE